MASQFWPTGGSLPTPVLGKSGSLSLKWEWLFLWKTVTGIEEGERMGYARGEPPHNPGRKDGQEGRHKKDKTQGQREHVTGFPCLVRHSQGRLPSR